MGKNDKTSYRYKFYKSGIQAGFEKDRLLFESSSKICPINQQAHFSRDLPEGVQNIFN